MTAPYIHVFSCVRYLFDAIFLEMPLCLYIMYIFICIVI